MARKGREGRKEEGGEYLDSWYRSLCISLVVYVFHDVWGRQILFVIYMVWTMQIAQVGREVGRPLLVGG